jgi:hypothetical protein
MAGHKPDSNKACGSGACQHICADPRGAPARGHCGTGRDGRQRERSFRDEVRRPARPPFYAEEGVHRRCRGCGLVGRLSPERQRMMRHCALRHSCRRERRGHLQPRRTRREFGPSSVCVAIWAISGVSNMSLGCRARISGRLSPPPNPLTSMGAAFCRRGQG